MEVVRQPAPLAGLLPQELLQPDQDARGHQAAHPAPVDGQDPHAGVELVSRSYRPP
jgi:hypothetical protein